METRVGDEWHRRVRTMELTLVGTKALALVGTNGTDTDTDEALTIVGTTARGGAAGPDRLAAYTRFYPAIDRSSPRRGGSRRRRPK